MMIYLRNIDGFKMDYFKGMKYVDIRPIFKKYFNSNVAFLEKAKEQMEEEDNKALKRKTKSQAEKATKKQKLDKEVEELKRHLHIVSNDDEVYTEATPLARKVPVVDYEIYTENNKPYYKIIRADESLQLFLSFLSLLRNFDREDLEVLWQLVKERFASSKPKNFSDDFLLTTVTYMFEKLDVQAQVWKNQRKVHGLAKVKSWRLLESCRVHIITFTSTQMILQVERRYPLAWFTLDQMLNNVRLEVKEESKVSLELLRFLKENQEKDKIETKPDKNEKRGEARKSQNQLQLREKEKLKKIQVEGPKVQIPTKYISERKRKGLNLHLSQRSKRGACSAISVKLFGPGTLLAITTYQLRGSSSKLSRDQTSNSTSSTNPTPKGRIRRSSKQQVENSNFEEQLTPVATMTDNRTMAEMLRAPTEGCAEAIVVPLILAEQFELKHSLINMMTSRQFFGLEKDNPHDHIRWGSPPQKFDESFHEAWERYQDLLRACPHHGFTELHQLDTFYNALNPADQDSLNAAAGGNLLEKSPQDALTIIENKSKVCNSQSKPIASPVNACDISSSSEIAKLTHVVNQQTSAVTTAMTTMLKQLQPNPPPAQVKAVEEICVTCGGAHPYYQCLAAGGNTFLEFKDNIQGSGSLPGNTVANPKGELKYITTHSGLVTNGPTIPTPPKSVTPEEEECVEETYTDPDLAKYTIKVPPPPVKKPKPLIQRHFVLHTRDFPFQNISELKCKALADLGASINLMPLSVWKKLGLPELIPTRMTLELANRAICTSDGIARDVFVLVGRPFLRTARALIDVHGEEMILRDGDERLTLNMKHDTAIYSNHSHRELVNLINIFNIPSEDCLEVSVSNKQSGNPTLSLHKEITSSEVTHEIHDSEGCNFLSEELPDIDSFNDIHPHFDDNPLNFDDNLKCDIESDLREIEFLLYQGEDSDLKDSIDQTDLANRDDYFVDPTPKMFTDEHAPDYSFTPRFDVYPDDFLEIESDADNFDNDPFDSKGEKIKESELLIDQLDLPCDILPYSEYDFFASQDFSRDDDLPSPDNKDKVFNPGILIYEKSVTIITRVAQEKKLAIYYASLVFEDFDPPFYEPLVFKEVPNPMRLLLFSSKNEEKVFKTGIYTSEKVHFCFLLELSHL
nr:hypothetical protein [Tanacetum cinerariifolium]